MGHGRGGMRAGSGAGPAGLARGRLLRHKLLNGCGCCCYSFCFGFCFCLCFCLSLCCCWCHCRRRRRSSMHLLLMLPYLQAGCSVRKLIFRKNCLLKV